MALKIDLSTGTARQQVTAGEMSGLLGARQIADNNKVVMLSLGTLFPFAKHTFRVTDNEEMAALCQSIRDNGILTPLQVRPQGNGYEIISGHRRHRAAQLAGLTELPCIIEAMDDDTATVRMVETNRYREHFLPSEKAFSYKAAADALNRQGRRSDLYGCEPTQSITDVTGESDRNVRNWIRLTYLLPELLTLVDASTIPIRAGVELSYLSQAKQVLLERYIQSSYLVTDKKTISVAQAVAIREAGESLMVAQLVNLLGGHKQPQSYATIKLKKPELLRIADYIPDVYRQRDTASYIIKALEHYSGYAAEQGED